MEHIFYIAAALLLVSVAVTPAESFATIADPPRRHGMGYRPICANKPMFGSARMSRAQQSTMHWLQHLCPPDPRRP
jgi:hypothetical protein